MRISGITLFLATLLAMPGLAGAQFQWQVREVRLKPAPADTQVVADFAFQNVGQTPLTISAVKTSCDCTSATLEKRVYAPGESGTISTERG